MIRPGGVRVTPLSTEWSRTRSTAGAYVYGRDGRGDRIRGQGRRCEDPPQGARRLACAAARRAHEGYVSWERFEAIRTMVSSNVPTSRHHGAPKHGDALLAGLIRSPPLRTQADAPPAALGIRSARYSCTRGWMDNGEPRCIAFGGLRVDDAIEEAPLGVVGPGCRRVNGCRRAGNQPTRSGARGSRPRP